jgi:hypothetical protein
VALFLLQDPPNIPRYVASGAIVLGLLAAMGRLTSIDSPI